MVFILLLILSATLIAGSAGFFAVYGLAATFSGTFWSVVLMGASLEAGKLIAASYLYRYWNKTGIWLKTYLMAGVATLMILTSTGIFGYLSAGYQQDVLPLKQMQEQVQMLEQEKERLVQRKTQIDEQIANLPANYVNGRVQLMRGFKQEQDAATARIVALDKDILENKTKLIQTQAHIGPITYIASAFGLDTDNATKYLIYLIIFAFDPMAVALTLAVNIALRLRKEEIEEAERQSHEERLRKMQNEHEERMLAEKYAAEEAAKQVAPVAAALVVDEHGLPEIPGERIPPMPPAVEPTPIDDAGDVMVTEDPKPEVVTEDFVDQFGAEGEGTEVDSLLYLPEPILDDQPDVVDAQLAEVAEAIEVEPLERPGDYIQEEVPPFREEAESTEELVAAVEEPVQPARRRVRPYGSINTVLSDAKLNELVQHYRWLRDKEKSGEALTQDDRWELGAIEEILRKHGLGLYIG